MMKKNYGMKFLAAAIFVLAYAQSALAYDLNLETEKIFAPGEPVTIQANTRGLDRIDFRIYRINDPEGYFTGQKHLHNPDLDRTRLAVGLPDIVAELKDKVRSDMRTNYRRWISEATRYNLLDALGCESAETAPYREKKYELFPVLTQYPLVERFTQYLDEYGDYYWYDTNNISMPIKEKGVYLIEGVYKDEVAYTVAIVSGVAFVSKVAPNGSLLYLVDRAAGSPIEGAGVVAYRRNEKVFEGQSDGNGLVPIPLVDRPKQKLEPQPAAGADANAEGEPKKQEEEVLDRIDTDGGGTGDYYNDYYEGEDYEYYDGYGYHRSRQDKETAIYVRVGEDFAIDDPSLYPPQIPSGNKVYIYSERPIYRPNQEVFYRAMLRTYTDGDYQVPGGKVKVKILDAGNQELLVEEKKIDAFGSIDGKLNLAEEAPLGTYSIVVVWNKVHYYGHFKVEEYKKPEYEVKVQMMRDHYISGETIEAEIAADYYFGAPVEGGEVEYNVYRVPYYIPWWYGDPYSWYYSEGGYESTWNKEFIESGTGTLDENGRLTVSYATSTEEDVTKARDYSYIIEARVTDLSRRSIRSSAKTKVMRAAFLTTIKTDRWSYGPNKEVTVTILARLYDGGPAPGAGLKVTVNRSWWEGGHRNSRLELMKQLNADTEGRAQFTFTPTGSGTQNIVVVGTDAEGRLTRSSDSVWVYSREYSWMSGDGSDSGDIRIIMDKPAYQIGETANAVIVSPVENCYALVTFEGRELAGQRVEKIDGRSVSIDFPIVEGYAPNVNLSVSIIKDDSFYSKSERVIVPALHRFINVTIESDKEIYKPGEEGTFTIITADSEGRPVDAQVSLGVVDASIYALAAERATEIEKYFYGLQPVNVSTTSSLFFRFFGSSRTRSLIAQAKRATALGDFKAEESADKPRVRKDFRDTAIWQPAVNTGSQGRTTVKLKYPDNLTRWRATARAISKKTHVGQVTYRTITRKNLMLRLETPRFLVVGDEVSLAGVVHNYLSDDQNVRIEVESEGLAGVGRPPQTLQVEHDGQARFDWRVKAVAPGTATVTAKALTGVESDALQLRIPVLPHGMMTADSFSAEISKKKTGYEYTFNHSDNASGKAARLELRLNPSVLSSVYDSLDYLINFPGGCVEQTMSSFLPDLLVGEIIKKRKLKPTKKIDDIEKYIARGTKRLYELQHYDGGWGWWEHDSTHPFMTAYALSGLIIGKKIGYDVDDNRIERGLNRLRRYIKELAPNETRAYALYVQSLREEPDADAVKAMMKQGANLSIYARSLLAMALQNGGLNDEANEVVRSISAEGQSEGGGVYWSGKRFHYNWEDDPIETTAWAMRALIGQNPENETVQKVIRWLLGKRDGDRWRSTRTSAMVIYALNDYIDKMESDESEFDAIVSLNGEEIETVFLSTQTALEKGDSVITIPAEKLKPGQNKISIEAKGKGVLYVSGAYFHFTEERDIAASDAGFSVKRNYYLLQKGYTSSGELVYNRVLMPDTVRSGAEILVEVEVAAHENNEFFILEDMLPAGCEVVREDRGYKIPDSKHYRGYYRWSYWYAAKEFRDEKIDISMTDIGNRSYYFSYILRAQHPGVFSAMPGRGSLMYYPEKFGHSAERRFTIID